MGEFNLEKYDIKDGFVLVIVNETFTDVSYLRDRPGADADRDNITKFCKKAGFTINDTDGLKTDDLTVSQMRDLFKTISERDFEPYDAFICFILSHGDKGGIRGVDGELIRVDEIVNNFRGRATLVDKPKLFFTHNYREKNEDRLVQPDRPCAITIPVEADILVAYSNADGYETYKNVQDGSLFMSVLMQVLNKHGHNMNLTDMLAIVSKEVASKDSLDRKQMPCFTSSLRMAVHFKHIGESHESQPPTTQDSQLPTIL